jgi:serine/threonine-protein kinase
MSAMGDDDRVISWAFGPYEVEGLVGRGGMGTVFRARQLQLDRIVALKMIHAEHQSDPADLSRFEREARAAAAVQHPNVVQIFDAGQIHGQSYFAMEYVEGSDLEDETEGGPLAPRVAARHVATVARAVHHLHGHNILHRDLKPSNILIAPDGRPKVTDFGIARILGVGAGPGKTTTGMAMGTPSYMAPEQASDDRGDIGPWTDVHGLGAVLYRLLTGRVPFDGETAMDTMLMAIHKPPPRPRVLNPAVPGALDAICIKCLEKRPDRRYPSAEAVALDLERFLAGDVAEAVRPNLWTHLRRWCERETNLAVHLLALSLVALAKLLSFALAPAGTAPTDLVVALLLGGWIGSGLIIHRLFRREGAAALAWGALDVLFLTGVLLAVNGARSAALVAYPVIIAGTGLWLRPRPVGVTTVLALAGFGVLVGDSLAWHLDRRLALDGYVIVAVSIVAAGLVTLRQVRRARALGLARR